MNDVYVDKFSDMIVSLRRRTGYPIDYTVQTYLSYLLANYIDRPGFWKDPVALRYLELRSSHSAKELGDTCLVITGLFPEYGVRRGLGPEYYTNIGISSYDIAAQATGSEILSRMSTEYVLISEFLNHINTK